MIRLAKVHLSKIFLLVGLLFTFQGKSKNKHNSLLFMTDTLIFVWEKVTADNYMHIQVSQNKGRRRRAEYSIDEQREAIEEQYWRRLRVIAPRGGESDGAEAGEGFCSTLKSRFYETALYLEWPCLCCFITNY